MNQRLHILRASAPALIGYGIFSLSGAAMWLFTMYWFLQWWGLLGLIAGLFIPPLASLFPFIYWWQESFPLTYILIWLIGVLALIVGVMASTGLIFRKARRSQKSKRRIGKIIEGEVVDE